MVRLGVAALAVLSLLPSSAGISFEVKGLTGDVAIANGVYSRTVTIANGYPCYHNVDYQPRSADHGIYLCMDLNGFWSVQPAHNIGTSASWVHSSARRMIFPDEAGPWLTHYAANWTLNPEVTVTAVAGREQPMVMRTIAVLIFGAMVAAAIVLTSMTCADPGIRRQSYWLMSAALTGTIALMLGKALMVMLYETLIPAVFGEMMSVRVVQIVLSFASFCTCFILLNLFGWKFQLNQSRMPLVNGLMAHIVAVLGCITFYFCLLTALKHLTIQFAELTPDPVLQKAIAGAIVVVVASVVLLLLSVASRGIRSDKYRSPPQQPWGQPLAPSSSSSTCMPSCPGTTYMPSCLTRAQADVIGMDWEAIVADAEDEASSVILGALIVLVLNVVFQGEALPLAKDVTDSVLQNWWGVVGVLLVLNLLVFLIRSLALPGGRVMGRLSRTIAMATLWSIMEALTWRIARAFPESSPTSLVAQAFLVSASAFVFLWVLDKVFDHLFGRRAKPGMRKLWGKLQSPSDTTTPAERARAVVSSGLGLIVAVLLTRMLIQAIQVLLDYFYLPDAEEEDRQTTYNYLLGLMCLVVAALFVRPYIVAVLPVALLSETQHQSAIMRELDQLSRI